MYEIETLFKVSRLDQSLLGGFCQTAQTETDNPSIENIRFDDWEQNPSSLMYAVYQQKRFDDPDGTFQMVYFEGKLVCLAGAYRSEFDSKVALVGCRAWTLPDHRARFLIGDMILPVQLDWARFADLDTAMFTFNLHNAWLAKMVLRASAGRALRFGLSNSEVYQNWIAHPNLCRIKETDQIVLYKNLTSTPRQPNLSDIDTGVSANLDQ
jgi:hypothetical protein